MPACLLLVMLFGQSAGIGCTKTTDTAVTDTFCEVVEPFRWSRHDTEETILQAKRLNAARDRLCGRAAPRE